LHHHVVKSNFSEESYYTWVSWSIVTYTCGFLWLKKCIHFSDRKTVDQSLLWVLFLMLMITVWQYTFSIHFYLADKDSWMNDLMIMHRYYRFKKSISLHTHSALLELWLLSPAMASNIYTICCLSHVKV